MKKVLLLLFLLFSLSLLTTACIGGDKAEEELSINQDELIAYLINDIRCVEENCNDSFIKNLKVSLRQFFPMIEFEEYDYNSDLGKQFYEKYALTDLPAILLTHKLEEEGNYNRIKNFVTEKFNNRKTEDEIEAMVSTCAEFMKCFVIMGYDFQGNAIKPIFYAKNDIDADALNQYIQKFIMSSIH